MKRFCKIAAVLLLAVSMIPAMALPASAKAATGEAVFDGSDLTVSFTQKEIKEAFTGLTPGDELSFTVDIKNTGDTKTKWYVENTISKTFEEGASAAGGAYEYSISYVPKGADPVVLYASSGIGGDNTRNGEGLEQVMSGSKEYFYLDELTAGGTGRVVIYVAIDGETLNNDYQETLADLELNFAVEADDGMVTPSTGDKTPLLLYEALFGVSGLLLLAFVYKWAKTRRAGHE